MSGGAGAACARVRSQTLRSTEATPMGLVSDSPFGMPATRQQKERSEKSWGRSPRRATAAREVASQRSNSSRVMAE